MTPIKKIKVQDIEISISQHSGCDDYICLTDMVKAKDGDARAADIIKNWVRNRGTIEFLGVWEQLNNPHFKVVEFDHFKKESGLPTFTMSINEWVKSTNAIGVFSRLGRYGGTYAHKDIAFEFGSAISPIFKLYLIKEYQRLKEVESNPMLGEWNVRRILSKVNYSIHTNAIKDFIIPNIQIEKLKSYVYADEADMLSIALWGYTAKQWRDANPTLASKGLNIRDTASINELVVLSNMESFNAELLKRNISRIDRYAYLRDMAQGQLSHLCTTNADNGFRAIEFQNTKIGK